MAEENGVENVNVIGIDDLIPPKILKEKYQRTAKITQDIKEYRNSIKLILEGKSSRKIVCIGPCSIHDEESAIEYAKKVRDLSEKVNDLFFVVMRVFLEKPRTIDGWEGIVYDPDMNGTYNLEKGLEIARRVLLNISEIGVPAVTEVLDPTTINYYVDFVSLAGIGARSVEAPLYRRLGSGLSPPVFYKNNTEGNIDSAINAVLYSKRHGRAFPGNDPETNVGAKVKSRGQQCAAIMLRGGKKPNYDSESVSIAQEKLVKAGLLPNLLIDCSHDNTRNPEKNFEKDYRLQIAVFGNIMRQIAEGNNGIKGIMMESHIKSGSVKLPSDMTGFDYSKLDPFTSVTDACVGWLETEEAIMSAYERLKSKDL